MHYSAISKEPTKELTIVREFEALKLQARQLEIVNRQLVAESEKLKYEKNANESKLIQKAAFEEEAMVQFQKEKSYQLEMMRVKSEEEQARLRRDYEVRVEDLQREIVARDMMSQEISDRYAFLEGKGQEARNTLENYELELMKLRDGNSTLTEQVTREEFANKKLEMLAEELERQRNEMESEIHVLLDI